MNNLWTTSVTRWLVWEWLLDGGFLDTSWNNNNWNWTNVLFVKTSKGYQSQAGSFNGGSSYVTIPDNSLLDTWLQTPTVNLWIKTTNTTGYNMCMWKGNSSWYENWALNFNWDWSNQIQFWMYDTSDKRSRISTK